MNKSEHLCLEAEEMALSTPLTILYIMKIIIGFIGVFLIVYLVRQKGCCWISNINTKVLFAAHIYFALHTSIFFTVIFIYQLIWYSTMIEKNLSSTTFMTSDPCFFIQSARLSCLIHLFPVFGVVSQTFNMFNLAMKRAIVTLCWHGSTTKPLLSVFLVLFSIVCAFSIVFLCDFLPISKDTYVTRLTIMNAQNVFTYQIACYFLLGLEILTALIFWLTRRYNLKRNNEMEHGINQTMKPCEKHQLAENVKVMNTLLPCYLLHCTINSFSYLGQSFLPIIYKTFDPISSAIWEEIFSISMVYSVFLPWVILYQSRKGHRVDSYNAQEVSVAHFQRLHQLFNK